MNAFHRAPLPAGLARLGLLGFLGLLLAATSACHDGSSSHAAIAATPTRSSTLALTSDGRRLVVVNRETDTVALLRVRDSAGDVAEKLAEVAVGREPRSVALTPDDRLAFVTNAASGTVSVLAVGVDGLEVEAEIPVGTEPRGIAATPNGSRVFVANHTAGTLSVIDVASRTVIDTRNVGGNPSALAISNDGDRDDLDETVFVTRFFAEPIPGGPGEGFDDGRQGVLFAVPVAGGAPAKITLAPLANSGFSADRTRFCVAFNNVVHSEIFCPDTTVVDPLSPVIAQDPQAVFPNQLQSLVLREGLLYVPSIGAQPEPPVKFNVNVQGLVQVVNTATDAEIPERAVNLNAQVKLEPSPPNPTQSLSRLFLNDLVAIDADAAGEHFLVVSRGGNYVMRASLDANGKLDISAPANVVRFQTGNIPNGVVMSPDGKRAYANNEVNVSVTAIDLEHDTVLERDIPAGTPPAPGSFQHSALVGKLAFHTALGVPDFGLFGTPVRSIVPLESRGKASLDAWSGCASCHNDGLADGVTWIFGTGPRQTIPLDAFFSKQNPLDQRISNYSAVMGSITDFNANAIGVQGGAGFAGTPPPATLFQHGITEGASDSLDAMTLWVQTIRPLNQPAPANAASAANGELVFADNCAACHGGAKWTKSQIVWDNNPTFNTDPNGTGVAFDPGLLNAKAQIRSFTSGANTLAFLENVGTFDAQAALEIRGQAAQQGDVALGTLGFNVPSLLSIRYHAPYLHDGSAQTLGDVFQKHALAGGTIASTLDAQDLADLEAFVASIDGATPTMPSDSDLFLQVLRGH